MSNGATRIIKMSTEYEAWARAEEDERNEKPCAACNGTGWIIEDGQRVECPMEDAQ